MKKIEVKVRYLFEGTYTIKADNHNEAQEIVTNDCGLVLGGNIHTTLDEEEVDWDFDIHPDMQILSYTEIDKKKKSKLLKMNFSDRIDTLRNDIINAIRQLLYSKGLTEITLPEEQYDPIWVIKFNWDGDPCECKVTGVKMTNDSITLIAQDKICKDEVIYIKPYELGGKNIDWLNEIYNAIWQNIEKVTQRKQ